MKNPKLLILVSFFGAIAVVLIIAGALYWKDANRIAKLGQTYADWKTVEGQISRFQAKLPGNPEYASKDLPIPDSEQVMKQELYVSGDDITSYYISATLYPAEVMGDEEENLRQALDGIVKAVPDGLEVFANYKVPFRGANFLEYKIYSPPTNTAYQGRLFLTSNTLYQVYISYTEENYNDDVYTYFENSFSL